MNKALAVLEPFKRILLKLCFLRDFPRKNTLGYFYLARDQFRQDVKNSK
jgi:hypothetical protein